MADPGKDSTSIEIRITTQGKLRNFIQYGVKSLQENPDRPLVLHTLPPRKSQLAAKKKKQADICNGNQNMVEKSQNPTMMEEDQPPSVQTPKAGSSKPGSSLSHSTTVIPKLISCVEVIKREWINIQKANIQSKPWPKDNHEEEYARGLEQYNELSVLEEVTDEDYVMEHQPNLRGLHEVSNEERPEMIIQLLTKKKHPRIQRTPYMKVTLCTRKLDLPGRVTYQIPPPPVRLSKGARRRARGRDRKSQPGKSATTATTTTTMEK